MVYKKQILNEYVKNFFLEREDELLSREFLINEFWGCDLKDNDDIDCSIRNNLAVAINGARKLLPAEYKIVSKRSQGYKLIKRNLDAE